MLVRVLYEQNAEHFENKQEVEHVLQRYIWPPRDVRELCLDFPHIPVFPTHLKVGGRPVEVLLSDPIHYMEALMTRTAIKAGFTKWFGGLNELDDLEKQFIAEGGTPEGFNKSILDQLEFNVTPKRKPWWKFW